jgi:Tol biopolymer transport system component
MEEINKPFLDTMIIAATNSNSKRGKGVLPHIPTTFPIFAISAILLLLLLLPSFLAIQSNQSAWAGTFPGPNGQIAFSSTRDGVNNYEIYVMNSNGSGQTRLTDEPDAFDGDPSWSPDGTKIAFVSDRDAVSDGDDDINDIIFFDIYVMNADDGSGQTRLTDNDGFDGHPSWSPDGTKIAFSSERDGTEESRNYEIYVMNLDGSGQTRLTDEPDADDFQPSWSPDGTKIAFVRDSDIYVMNANDGSGQTRLTDEPDASNFFPSWSPDGTKIAFSSERDGNSDIYVMNADDGSGQTRLTDNDGFDGHPSWSPDGTKIAFVSDRDDAGDGGDDVSEEEEDDGNFFDEIYVMNANDGSGQTRLTDNDAIDISTDWGTNTSAAGGDGNGSGGNPPPPEQAIDEAISTIQN